MALSKEQMVDLLERKRYELFLRNTLADPNTRPATWVNTWLHANGFAELPEDTVAETDRQYAEVLSRRRDDQSYHLTD